VSPRSDKHWRLNPRIAVVALHDVTMAALSFELAVWLRYLTYGAPQSFGYLWEGTLLFTATCAVVFLATGLYRGIWYYASSRDLVAIAKAVTLAMLVFLPLMFALNRLGAFPRTALVINWPILALLLAGPRLLYRLLKDGNLEAVLERGGDGRVPVLLVGAGDTADGFIREMSRSRLARYRVVGLIDDKPHRVGRDIRGVRVLGTIDALGEVVERLDRQHRRPQRLILATDKLDSARARLVLEVGDTLGLPLARIPHLTDFKPGESAPEIVPVEVADLLGRPQKVLDRDAMARLIAGRRVLVTGAGGTIGSELCRQVAGFGPEHLALVDSSEFNLYQIDLELAEAHAAVPRAARLGDVRDRERIARLFAEERPELVFHAAALKHVPVAEAEPDEAALTNAIGTRNTIAAARAAGARLMVMISTDKAVNPTNVMGATKRIAELAVEAAGRDPAGLRCVTVRFGNVLGSTGSVVPLFQRQIARGGPLTVTHPEVTRFFMTTREAVELVLQASAIDAPAALYVLDMGTPVRIADLARQMIQLAGKRPERDVALNFTGLRPGEKLHEELFHVDEAPSPTPVDGVLVARPRSSAPEFSLGLDQLERAARAGRTHETLALIRRLVPEYAKAVATAAE
jgi:O-antigen biosynthesis protein WbqV